MIIVDIVIYCGGCQLLDFCWYHWSNGAASTDPWPVAPGLMVHLSKELLGSGRYEHMEYVDSPHCCVIIHHPTWKPCPSCSTYGHSHMNQAKTLELKRAGNHSRLRPHVSTIAYTRIVWQNPLLLDLSLMSLSQNQTHQYTVYCPNK